MFEGEEGVAVDGDTGFGHADAGPECVGVEAEAEGGEFGGGGAEVGVGAAREFGDTEGCGPCVFGVVVDGGGGVGVSFGLVGVEVRVDVGAQEGREVLQGLFRAEFVVEVVDNGEVDEEVRAVKGEAGEGKATEVENVELDVLTEEGVRVKEPLEETATVLRQVHAANHAALRLQAAEGIQSPAVRVERCGRQGVR